MPTELVTPEIFLARLTQAFEKPDAGAVWLTAKRCKCSLREHASGKGHATYEQSSRQHELENRRTAMDRKRLRLKILKLRPRLARELVIPERP